MTEKAMQHQAPEQIVRTRVGRAVARQLAAECRALKGTGLITPGYWIQENREAVAMILDAFAEKSDD